MNTRTTVSKRKKIALASAALLLLSCLFSGCQPTPEEAVVIQKNTRPLIKEAQTPDALPSLYEAPAHYDASFSCQDETVTVLVDAAVTVPAQGVWPVVEMETGEVSIDFIEQAAGVLFEGQPIYEPKVQMTKEEIEAEILDLKEFMTPANMDEYYQGDQDVIADVRELFENRILIFEDMYSSAPDAYTPVPAKMEFQPMKYYEEQWLYEEMMQEMEGATDQQSLELQDEYENGRKIILDAELPDGLKGRIEGYNYVNGSYHLHYFRFARGNKEEYRGQPVSVMGVVPFTEEEAAGMATDALQSIGIGHMYAAQVWADSNPPMDPDDPNMEPAPWQEPDPATVYAYQITFLPLVDGIPVLYSDHYGDGLYTADEYGPYYGGEKATVTVDEKGVASIYWEYPLIRTAAETGLVQLMPFQQVMERFQQQMQLSYTLYGVMGYDSEEALGYLEDDDYMKGYLETLEGVEITIDAIRLGMERVPVKDQPGIFEYIPAWKFYGSHVALEPDGQEQEPLFSSDGPSLHAYLSLSAIDGSVL